ncbi:calcium-binding protein [Ruegeria sp. ANG-R]|uniref:Hint domain-containing protein n=1 Tax=Ruegeria sp. ANG-R TaxID=1577903 RepID=UPI00057DA529|nr:Hint domain-containing protein [Ruegeria sp. ANG-R]KIC38555.1 calcium-binding protein [Ruegeria sp. ANG-R]
MAITIYGAFRSDSTMTDFQARLYQVNTTFQISQYSQITITDGADPTVIDGDDQVNEVPNDPTQTYLGRAFDWDYTIRVRDEDGNTHQIGIMDWDTNNNGQIDTFSSEQGYFLGFIGGTVPPLNSTLTIIELTDNGPDIDVDTVVPCFCAGTQIETTLGARAIETLSAGDKVVTLDHGPQSIRWIGARSLDASDLACKPKLRPIRIAAGSLGSGLPHRDLLVSPQHRMLIRSTIAVRMFDSEEVLVPAHKLVGIPGITVDEAAQGVVYYHMLFDRHEIVLAEGAPSESLFTGKQALKGIHPDALAEIAALFPEVTSPDHHPVAARQIPERGKQIHTLLRRHIKNDRALIRSS